MILLALTACLGDTGLVVEVEKEVYIDVPVEVDVPYDVVHEGIVQEFHLTKPMDKVDVVYLVDTSGSMNDEINQLAVPMTDLVTDLATVNVDWQMLITPADSGSNCAIMGSILTPASTNPAWEILEAVQDLKASPLQGEEGMAAAFGCVISYPDFFRHEADLFWVFVSDEPEQSGITVSYWTALWADYKPAPYKVYAAGIVPTEDGGCKANACDKYLSVSSVVVDICDDTDWTPALNPLRDRVGLSDTYLPLEYTPTEGTIQVFINGTKFDQWAYINTSNSIHITEAIDYEADILVFYLTDEVQFCRSE